MVSGEDLPLNQPIDIWKHTPKNGISPYEHPKETAPSVSDVDVNARLNTAGAPAWESTPIGG